MTNHHLSVEQRFHLEAAFREIDACQDLEKLREVTKQIITAQENEKAFAREAMSQLRKEMEFAASNNSVSPSSTEQSTRCFQLPHHAFQVVPTAGKPAEICSALRSAGPRSPATA